MYKRQVSFILLSGICVVANKVLNLHPLFGEIAVKSIDVFLLVNLPNNSVCPANLCPALCQAILEIGAVTRALAFPSKSILVAFKSHLKLAEPVYSSTIPGITLFSKGISII